MHVPITIILQLQVWLSATHFCYQSCISHYRWSSYTCNALDIVTLRHSLHQVLSYPSLPFDIANQRFFSLKELLIYVFRLKCFDFNICVSFMQKYVCMLYYSCNFFNILPYLPILMLNTQRMQSLFLKDWHMGLFKKVIG